MKKIAVRIPQWLGDAVVSTAFMRRLKNRFPDADIWAVCTPSLASIFESHPEVHAVVKLPYPEKNVFAAADMIAAEKFDGAYILPNSFRAALEFFLAKVPIRVGYAGDMRRFLLTQAVHYDAYLRYAHRYLRLIDEERLPLDQAQPYFPSVAPVVIPPLKSPVLGLAPVSIAPSRTWLPERFAEIANRFHKERGGTVILFGSPRERAQAELVKSRIVGPVIDTVGGLSLPELGWMISQCQVLVANDSGLMHVASCFKIPTVVVFGASDPKFALPPWGTFVSVQHTEISCVPCLRNYCVRFGNDHNACLKAVQADEVWSVLASI